MRIPPIDEGPSDTPNYDRLRRDPSPTAKLALSMIDAMPRGRTPEAQERIATRHYMRVHRFDSTLEAVERTHLCSLDLWYEIGSQVLTYDAIRGGKECKDVVQ